MHLHMRRMANTLHNMTYSEILLEYSQNHTPGQSTIQNTSPYIPCYPYIITGKTMQNPLPSKKTNKQTNKQTAKPSELLLFRASAF